MSEGIFVLPRTDATNAFRQVKTAAFGTAGVSISPKNGRIYRIAILNGGATAYTVQLHNKATAPVNGDIPIWERRLPASGELDIDFGLTHPYFATGIGLAISTTTGTLTLAAANDAVAYLLYTTVN